MTASSATSTTMYEHAAGQLRALSRAAGLERDEAAIVDLFRDLAASWGDTALDEPPRWSCIADDVSPVEFSIVAGGSQPELRVLIEAHEDPASPLSYWRAARQLTARLKSRLALNTESFDEIEELFCPVESVAPIYFAMAHAVVFRPDATPLLKVYLNPAAQDRAPESTCEQALQRLGLGGAWPRLAEIIRPHVRPAFFALDVSRLEESRVKVYVRHRGGTVEDLERTCSAAPDYRAGDARAFCEAITGTTQPMLGRPVVGLYLHRGGGDAPARAALHMPVYPYMVNDAVARQRIGALLTRHGLRTGTYERCVEALANRPLSDEQGLHSWVSFQRDRGAPRITLYFGSRMYAERYGLLGVNPARFWPSPLVSADRAPA